jgi:preprotein translocase subunit SecG
MVSLSLSKKAAKKGGQKWGRIGAILFFAVAFLLQFFIEKKVNNHLSKENPNNE